MTTDSIEAADRLAADRLAGIRAAMGRAASLTGRTADDITLIAVSKTQAADAIRPLIAAGQRVFGENRSEERREGKECVSTGRSQWAQYHSKKKKHKDHIKTNNH